MAVEPEPEPARTSQPAAAHPSDSGDETEAALGARLRRGDPGAFDAVYRRDKHAVHRFLVRLSGRPDLADDLFQETWLRLARSAPRLRHDTRLRSWLFTVARNLHVSHIRRGVTDRTRADGAAEIHPAAPPTPYDDAAAGEARQRLEAALAALPLAQREAVLLCAIERLEPAEAARVVDVSPEAFRQRLARGRALLRRALDEGAAPTVNQPQAAGEGGAP